MKKVISIILIGVLLMTMGLFSACNPKEYTEEEHIQKITELAKDMFFFEDGKAKNYIWENSASGIGAPPFEMQEITGFEVSIVSGFDGAREYFLIEFEPFGHTYGLIYKNGYYLFASAPGCPFFGISLFKKHNIEKDNRYCGFRSFASKIDGVLIELHTVNGYESGEFRAFDEQQAKKAAESSRTMWRKNYSRKWKLGDEWL